MGIPDRLRALRAPGPAGPLILGVATGLALSLAGASPTAGGPGQGCLIALGLSLGGLLLLLPWPALPRAWVATTAGLLLAPAATPAAPPPRPLEAASRRPGALHHLVARVISVRPTGRGAVARLRVLRLDGAPETRSIRAYLPASIPPILEGDQVLAEARLDPLLRPANPGQRDGGRALLDRGLSGSARVRHLARLASGPPSLRRWMEPARRRLRATLEAAVASPSARGLLRALALGEAGTVPPGLRRAFATAGLSHLLAVSGLHLGILCLGLYGALRRGLLWVPGLRLGATPLAAGATMLATGLTVTWMDHPASASRAGLMILPLLLALALGRRARPGRALLAAALVLLLWTPALAHSVGFQLSCAATAGLILGLRPATLPIEARPIEVRPPRRPEVWRRAGRALVGLADGTLFASAATAALVARTFGRLPVLGALTNLAAVPLATLLLACLTPAALAAVALGPVAAPLFTPARTVAGGLEALARWAAAWPLASVRLPPPTTGRIALHLVFLGLALVALRPRSLRRLGALAALGVLLWPVRPERPPPAPLAVTFLSVGHGDAVLLRTAAGDVLVDGGGDPEGTARVGDRVVVPALQALGVRRLAAVVLTHAHPDHFGGLRSVLEAFPVGALYTSGQGLEPGEALWPLREAARRRGVPLRLACRDPLPDLTPVELACLWPRGSDPEGPWDPLASTNDNSVVLRVALGAIAFLLPGDLEAEGEAALLATGAKVRATVLKAPHHGSTTSSTPAFVAAVAPRHVVYSVGRHERFGFPRPQVVRRWAAAGARTWRTDRDGALTFLTEGRSLRVRAFLRSAGERSAADRGNRGRSVARGPSPPLPFAPDDRGGRGSHATRRPDLAASGAPP